MKEPKVRKHTKHPKLYFKTTELKALSLRLCKTDMTVYCFPNNVRLIFVRSV